MRNRCRRQPAITTCTSGIQPREEGCEGDSPVLSRCWPRFTRALEPAPLSLRIASCVITRFHVTIKKRSRNPPLPTLAARPTFRLPSPLSFSAFLFRANLSHASARIIPPFPLRNRSRFDRKRRKSEEGEEERRRGYGYIDVKFHRGGIRFAASNPPWRFFDFRHVKASKWNFACRFIGRSMVSILSTVKKKKKKVKGGSTRVIE